MAKPIELEINGKRYAVQCDPETSLLSALRDELALTAPSMAVAKDNAARARIFLPMVPNGLVQAQS